MREYYQKHKKEHSKYMREYYQKNKEKIIKYSAEWYIKNKATVRKKQSKYEQIHRKERRIYESKKRKNNIQYRLACNLRTRINSALRGKNKSASTMELIGCSIEFLKQHLEKIFQYHLEFCLLKIDMF